LEVSLSSYRAIFIALVSAAQLFIGTATASAATITVTNTTDNDPGSLRQAISSAVSGDTIDFAIPTSDPGYAAGVWTINLTSGELGINKDLTISGPGVNALVVQRSSASGTPTFRIFDIATGGFNVSISGMIIANGSAPSGGGILNNGGTLTVASCTISGNFAADGGGGAYNDGGGTLKILNSIFSDNSVLATLNQRGGGIYNLNGTLTITNSTFSGNTGLQGGGIGNASMMSITNSTISANSTNATRGHGGGIYNSGTATITNSTLSGNNSFSVGGGVSNDGTVTITNSTLSNNSAGSSSNGGGGIFNTGAVNARNTIIALNTGSSAPDFNGTLSSQGFNLIGNTGGTTITGTTTGNQLNVDPKLGPLQNNGGPTFTHTLLFGSPAIDGGHSSGSVTDQRGFTRPVDIPGVPNATGGDGADIGAVELSPIQFSAASYSVAENAGSVTLTVTRSGDTSQTATIHYATSNGTATASSDYNSTSGDLTFAPGETSKPITVQVLDDSTYEGDESFTVTLSSPMGADLGLSTATVTIFDNDSPPMFQFSSTTYGIGEAAGTVTITVTKTGSTAVDATVHFTTSDGTASAPGDYTSTAGDLTFAPADTSISFTVPINNDTTFEGNENFEVRLSAPTNATLGANNSATVTIVDNDPAPTVQFSAANYNVNESAGTATVTVTKIGSTALTTTVHYATSDGSAAAPGDYTAISGDLTFAPGETSKDFTVPIVNDSVFEATESFSVALSLPGNSTLGTQSTATVTITDNDPAPTVQFSPVSYAIGEGNGPVILTVTKTGSTAVNATVHFATSDGTAVAPGDYTSTSGDLTFAPSETSKQISVPIINDTLIENDETFNVTLSAPSSATLGTPSTATVTIIDNDALPQVKWTSVTYSADENSGNAALMVRRTGNDAGNVVVHYSTADGTAKAGSDYMATSGDLTFLAGGPLEQTVNIPLINDNIPESTEDFTVTLSQPSGGTIGTPSTATVSITDTDTAPSPTPTPTATPGPTAAQALNLSARLQVESGDHAMIGGFIITGNGFKQVVLRGLGPSLVPFGVTDFLPDPVLELRRSNGSLIIRNNDWKDNQRSQIEGTPFQPKDDRESVIVATLQPGRYSAILTENNDMTGIGLLEVYDTDPPSTVQLANISTRGFVRTGEKVMIGGFTLGGNSNSPRIVVRGLGPSLKKFFLTDLLADPTLELHNANGTPTIVNDNWQDDPASAALLTRNNFAPEDPHEAAIFITLPAGPYTAILAGRDGSSGLGLVEIYNLQ
jgi:GrpB-like predicted nucleotidyltransferase (UPF0157 family)